MKMQKTEMEFVTFEAQDVIATSGVVTLGKALYGTGATFNSYSQIPGNTKFGNGNHVVDSTEKYWFYAADTSIVNGLVMPFAATSDAGATSSQTAGYLNQKGGVDNFVFVDGESDFAIILDWLTQNGIQ